MCLEQIFELLKWLSAFLCSLFGVFWSIFIWRKVRPKFKIELRKGFSPTISGTELQVMIEILNTSIYSLNLTNFAFKAKDKGSCVFLPKNFTFGSDTLSKEIKPFGHAFYAISLNLLLNEKEILKPLQVQSKLLGKTYCSNKLKI